VQLCRCCLRLISKNIVQSCNRSPLLCERSVRALKSDVARLLRHSLAYGGSGPASVCRGREQHLDGNLLCRKGNGEQIGCEDAFIAEFEAVRCYEGEFDAETDCRTARDSRGQTFKLVAEPITLEKAA
jgi:hypothetical protein